MNVSDILKQKNMTKYKLSKISGVSFTTISEITTGKSKIKNCTGDTLYRLAKALDVTIEDLLADSIEYSVLQSIDVEKQSKDILMDFDKIYPGKLKSESIDSILEQAKQKRKKRTINFLKCP